MIKLKIKAKRAKFVFKKWLQWEKQMIEQGKGSDKNLAKVKALAEEYVEKSGKGIDV